MSVLFLIQFPLSFSYLFLVCVLSNSFSLFNFADSPEYGAVPLRDQHDQDTTLGPNEQFMFTAKKINKLQVNK